MRRLYEFQKVNKSVRGKLVLSEGVLLDLQWWKSFMVMFNGRAKVLKQRVNYEVAYSDSSTYGFGMCWGSDYIFGRWNDKGGGCSHEVSCPTEPHDSHINILEMWPLVAGVHRWCYAWRNKCVYFFIDNTQVEAGIHSGKSINPFSMAWLRELFWVSAMFNIELIPVRVPSDENIVADASSRLNEYSR